MRVGGSNAVVLISFSGGARSSVFGCVGEDSADVGCDCLNVSGVKCGVGGFREGCGIGAGFEEVW